jgi:hypothetical protein
MLARLGNVLYWAGCLAAAIWIAVLVAVFLIEHREGTGIAIAAVAGAVPLWVAGRACLYVLAGR